MKTIYMFTPSFAPHGGIRVILEWANRLARDNIVYLRSLDGRLECDWFPIDRNVRIVVDDNQLDKSDLMIITSPHSIHYSSKTKPQRKVIFLQMLEHLFQPNNTIWQEKCKRTYLTPLPLILISGWNEDYIKSIGRQAETHVVGNGVNLDHFPIEQGPKYNNILVEGWIPTNPSKDSDRIAPKVARALKAKGYNILAYSQLPLQMDRNKEFHKIPNEFYCKPSLRELNSLYNRATILLKATHFDARSCAPMEAMTKGTVTVRAIDKGDDDLIHGVNCLRTGYYYEELLLSAQQILGDENLRNRLAENCFNHVRRFNWDFWMSKIESIIWQKIR